MKWQTIKYWSLVRKLQLGMGTFCLGDFLFFSQEGTVLLLGAILLTQAICNFQFGCASGVCSVPKPYLEDSNKKS